MKASNKLSISILCVLTFISSTGYADIFGNDDRLEAFQVPKVSVQRKAVAVGVLTSLIDPLENGRHRIYTDKVSDFLCPDERFADQSSVAYACTGYLIAPDLLLTAGHCATHEATRIRREPKLYCESYAWVFDYYRSASPILARKDSVYNCKKILFAVFDGPSGARDFALIQLDRPVRSRKPLKMAQAEPSLNDSVYMLGHPMGLPMKYADQARITHLNPQDAYSLYTNLDAQAGNSGSPVFNRRNEVIGTLVGGLPNEVTFENKVAGCERYNYCDENGENCKVFDTPGRIEALVPAAFSEVQRLSKYSDIINSYIK